AVAFPPALGPWHTAKPSLLQRLSVCLLHVRRWPPAATHAAISSAHARLHCLASDAASAAGPLSSATRSAGRSVNRRAIALTPFRPSRSPVHHACPRGSRVWIRRACKSRPSRNFRVICGCELPQCEEGRGRKAPPPHALHDGRVQLRAKAPLPRRPTIAEATSS